MTGIDLADLLHTYGYWMVAIGSFVEGESVLMLAGAAARQEWLWLPAVMATAFAGSLAGDQCFFWLGRRQGDRWFDGRPRWQERRARAQALIEQHGTLFVFAYRFIYGIRTVTPLILGASGYPGRRFVLLNLLNAALWAVLIGWLGYTASALAGEGGQGLAGLWPVALVMMVLAFAWHRHRRAGDTEPPA